MEPDDPGRRHTRLPVVRVIDPARTAVEARSDLTFLQEGACRIAFTAGCTVEVAAGMTLAVMTTPTVAVRRNLKCGAKRIVQSVVLQRLPSDFEVRVTVELLAHGDKPVAITIEDVDCALVDLDDPRDSARLIEVVERWWSEFPIPHFKFPEPFPLRGWAWLGDSGHAGLLDIPPDWKRLLEQAGVVYGVKPLVVGSASQLRSWSVQDRVEHAFILNGAKWAATFPSSDSAKEIEVTRLGRSGETFTYVLRQIRDALLAEARAANARTPPSRALEPGEVVYHRKVGNSRKFDRFDAGSPNPCSHGADQFKGWSGDKATKGMARRYDNFTPDMLIHCDKYPKCGMYGVDAARGGLKAPPPSA